MLRTRLFCFVRVGLQIFADAVSRQVPPWKTTLCVRGTIHLKTSSAGETCDNRSVIWGRMAWGITREFEVYEDTLMSAAFEGSWPRSAGSTRTGSASGVQPGA
jgi:hypothetical protein